MSRCLGSKHFVNFVYIQIAKFYHNLINFVKYYNELFHVTKETVCSLQAKICCSKLFCLLNYHKTNEMKLQPKKYLLLQKFLFCRQFILCPSVLCCCIFKIIFSYILIYNHCITAYTCTCTSEFMISFEAWTKLVQQQVCAPVLCCSIFKPLKKAIIIIIVLQHTHVHVHQSL